MRVLALAWFDPASVVLSHRDLMRAAGHDMRLAVVRAYTERQREADYVCEQLVFERTPISPLAHTRRAFWERLNPDLDELREFAASADVIQFHPGIGHGDGDWASREGVIPYGPQEEAYKIAACFRWTAQFLEDIFAEEIHFIHGSRATWSNLPLYQEIYRGYEHEGAPVRLASSTIDYATELDAAYLPPFVDVGTRDVFTAINTDGSTLGTFGTEQEAQKAFPGKGIVATPIPLRASLRGDDDPLLIAHTPTDRIACSTEEFLKTAQGLGIPVRLGEGLKHSDVLRLKAECNAGFDHLRGAFSVNSLENAALGLIPLFRLGWGDHDRGKHRFELECMSEPVRNMALAIQGTTSLAHALRALRDEPQWHRGLQQMARSWWETYFSAEPITKRLVKFYEGL